MSTQFWLNNPMVLFDKYNIHELWPTEHMDIEKKLNAISRLIIILTILGFLVTRSIKFIITGVITLGIIVALYHIQTSKKKKTKITKDIAKTIKEGFTNGVLYKIKKDDYTNPTKNNPAMNVLLTDIKYNPTRKPAAPAFNPEVEKEMNTKTRDMVLEKNKENLLDSRLFRDLGDNFDFDQSMRSFYATANTSIPNDQTAFADFLYGDMISCKEGNAFACSRENPRWQS
jgi:hypothetical protein